MKALYKIFPSFLFLSTSLFAHEGKEYFKDKDGFFFFVGVDVPNRTVNLLWDEVNNKPVKNYVLERSLDGQLFVPVIKQNADNKPRDVRDMSEQEQASLQTLNTIIYTTETGNGRFIFNEPIPVQLIKENYVLRQVVENRIQWEDKKLLESLYANILQEKPLIYRIKFVYADGSIQYSGQRSLSDYITFILKRALEKVNDDNTMFSSDKNKLSAWPTSNNASSKSNSNPIVPLGACPPVNVPACVLATGNSNITNGTCCTYKQEEYKEEQVGGTPCSVSNNGVGMCSPLILDCPPTSSDPCCAGGGCTHYPVCGCRPWECCVYTQPPVWYVTQSTNLTPPTASFTYNNVCIGQPTTFSNTSAPSGNSGAITTYAWNFGDGNTSALQNPSNTYAASGNYTVTLTVTTNNNCTSTVTNVVTVTPQPVANFSATTVCLGTATPFTNTSTGGATTWNWNFGDAGTSTLQNPSHIYAAAGNYTVTLIASAAGGCSSTISIPVSVYPNPVAAFASSNVCLGNPSSFTDQSTGGATSWNWNFGDGTSTSSVQNPSHTYTASGTYTVTLSVSAAPGGCTSTVNHVMTISPSPVANFSATTVCLGSATQFSDMSTGGATIWSWNFGDGNTSAQQSPSHTYAAAGNYTVILTASSTGTCSSTFPLAVTVNPQPAAVFSATTVCLGNTTQFTDQSTGGGTTWNWNFGDGNTSTLQSPTHTYSTSGTFTATLNVSAPGGCNSTATQVITINSLPVSNFSATTVCFGNSTQFTNLSTGGGNSWSWNFGNGNTSVQQNPSSTYSASGTYSVSLIAITANGCQDTTVIPITVNPLPVANFTTTPVCVNTPPTSFTDQSTGANQWSWNFGDGSPNSASQNPSHNYVAAGNYSVTLIVTTSNGCKDTVSQNIIVNPVPIPNFTFSNVCFNNITPFTDQSTGNPTQWAWNFGDGNTSAVQSPPHTYNNPGNYAVTLVATNSFGCKDSIQKNIIVNPLPLANFTSTTVCIGNTTFFTDNSTIVSGNIITWSWNFADTSTGVNNISNQQNPSHLFSAAGNYNVILTVTSNNGCQSTTGITVYVNSPPVAAFTAPKVCLNSVSQFADGSTGAAQWYWQFGDGGTSTIQNPTHSYLGYGNYVVTLIVTSAGNCKDTAVDTITVYSLPVVNFTSDTVCQGKPTPFADLSFIPLGTITAWHWDFGDGNTSSLQNPTHIYASAGTYNVTLTATSAYGCVSSIQLTTLVHPLPNADFSFKPGPVVSITDNIAFTDLSTGGVASWAWDFGDSVTSIKQNPFHRFSDTGTYVVTEIVVSPYGCVDTIRHPLKIEDYTFYIPTAFTPNADGKNEFFFGVGIGITEYEMSIFDRWGNLIFYCKVNDLPQTLPCMWDGTVKGGNNVLVQEDVYVWKVHLTNVFKDEYDYIGTVTVVR